ncbi:hypothetical protein LSM04_003292 [Trypanosoma melophagium]|uniref:uncharacterized protein n=1 Tax=Trypanosoma melophagium TaxID=715481 RepID=UPI003519E677|nr:hypothetical protein LSM04_003292 [Trypanosoma melophagium]
MEETVRREVPQGGDSTELKDISIAFKNSAYATPYGDNTIPGNRPGHCCMRLGRDFAPDPITKSSLATDLHVPGNGLGPFGHVYSTDLNNVQHALCLRGVEGDNYVLDSMHGGRRHFDEPRGYEAAWIPSMRQLSPPMPEALWRSPRRRGHGVFNPTMYSVEARDTALLQGKGKAVVPRPPDHTVLELGLVHHHHPNNNNNNNNNNNKSMRRGVGHWRNAAAAPPYAVSPSAMGSISNNNSGNGSVSMDVKLDFLPPLPFTSPSKDETRVRWDYLGTRRQPIVVSSTGKASIYAEQQRQRAAAQIREEDIQLVRSLPK